MRLYAREPGRLRGCWDELGLDDRRALLVAVIDKAIISRARLGSPAGFGPGRESSDGVCHVSIAEVRLALRWLA
jgi:hypothetical protein